MAVEAARGCGYRKVNGLYLVGEGLAVHCDRLPYKIENCPVCGSGIKFSRGWTWLQWDKYAGDHSVLNKGCTCGWKNQIGSVCPICHPNEHTQPYGLLFVGEKFYSPEEFIRESLQMGVCKRIAAVPKNLELKVTWVLLAHKHVIHAGKDKKGADIYEPAIFYAFRPTSIEYLIWQRDATPEKLAELDKKGITAIIIPDGDVDHDPSTPLGLDDDEKEEQVNKVFFTDLRNKLGRK